MHLDYNLILGRNWLYAITIVTSLVFCFLQFPHQGKIVTIDQLDFCSPAVTYTMENDVPLLGKSPPPYHTIGVGILKYSSLIKVFLSISSPPTTQISIVNMISSTANEMSKVK